MRVKSNYNIFSKTFGEKLNFFQVKDFWLQDVEKLFRLDKPNQTFLKLAHNIVIILVLLKCVQVVTSPAILSENGR